VFNSPPSFSVHLLLRKIRPGKGSQAGRQAERKKERTKYSQADKHPVKKTKRNGEKKEEYNL